MIIVSKYIVMIGKLMNYGATYVLYIFVVYYKKLYKGREVLDKLLVLGVDLVGKNKYD